MNLKLPQHGLIDLELYIVRHGETDYNLRRVIQGRGINAPLNETGQAQAKAFFNRYVEVDFDAVFASSLLRTQQTLQPFVDHGYNLLTDSNLDEIDWGIYEGKVADYNTDNEFNRLIKQWQQGDLHEKFPGGESPRELQNRQLAFLNDVLKHHRGRVLICTHGRAMRSLLCTLTGKDLCLMDDFPHVNLALYKLNFREGVATIETFNCTRHLNG